MRKLTDDALAERERRIREMHAAGLSQPKIGQALDLSDVTVRRHLRQWGIKGRVGGRVKYTEAAAACAVALYNKGRSMLSIERETGIDDQAVKRLLIARGVPIRPETVKPCYSDGLRAEAMRLYGEGKSAKMVARALGLKPFTVKGWLTEAGLIRSMSEAAALYFQRGGKRGRSYRHIAYRSAKTGRDHLADSSFEAARMRQLDADPAVADWDVCRDRIPYCGVDGKVRHYVPDLSITYANGQRAVEEIKPAALVGKGANPLKIVAGRAYYAPKGIAFRVMTEAEIGVSLIQRVVRESPRYKQTQEDRRRKRRDRWIKQKATETPEQRRARRAADAARKRRRAIPEPAPADASTLPVTVEA